MSEIFDIDFKDEGRKDFLTYSEEVLTDRAVPSAEDGLLSSQRKILWTMKEYLKMNSSSKTKKCQSIVGSTLLTAYYHGDASCYGVLVKLAQPFLMRYPLITGQGALGTQESNSMVASSRYTEAKPSVIADLMMEDFKKNTVPLKRTYNDEYDEPVVLPSIFPNAICNGRQTIAIGLAHCSMPHNLIETCDGIIAYINNNDLTINELMKYMKGPDFPCGGTIINAKDIVKAFDTGHSEVSLKVQGDYIIEGQDIIFTSIPYRVYREKIKEQINDNIEEFDKVLDDFSDLSNLGKTKLVFHVKKDVSTKTALMKLFNLTDLQSSLSYNMNYIVNGTPKMCSMLNLIKAYYEHRIKVLIRATEYDKDKAEKRAYIIGGLLKAIDKIDEVISIIKSSKDKKDATTKLINFLSIDVVQAEAILDMKLSKLTRIDKDELVKELEEKEKIIEECNKVLTNNTYRDSVLIKKIEQMKAKYGDERRTKIVNIEIPKEEKEIAYVEPEKCVVVMSESGLIKRIPATSFKTQRRNGKGVKTVDDVVNCIIRTNTIDSLMVFTDKGTMYRILVDSIPVGNNTTKGTPITSLIEMCADEHPVLIYSIYRDTAAKYVLFTTKNGIMKKTALDEYIKTKKKTGIAAITIKENDSLANVCLVNDEDIIVVTKNGYVLEFDSKEVTTTGRTTMGMKAIVLGKDDEVIATLPVHNKEDSLAIFTEKGMGKKVSSKEIVKQSKSCKGLFYYKPTEITGNVAAATLVENEDNILVIGQTNSICVNAKDIPEQGRTAVGGMIIKGNIKAVSKI